MEINTGQRAYITVTYNSASDPVVKPGKRVLKTVELWSNDPKKKMIILALQGIVKESSGPRVEINETTYDFGTVNEGSIVRHDFKIRNSGDEVLRIKEVVRS